MRVIANSKLTGSYGTVEKDEIFIVDDELAKQLLYDGKVRRPDPPAIIHETKVISPPEVGPAIPFCDLPLPHQEPEEIPREIDPVFPAAGVSTEGAPDPGGRGKSGGSPGKHKARAARKTKPGRKKK